MDEKTTNSLLEGAIKDSFMGLKKLNIGDEKYSHAVESISKLYTLKTTEEKNRSEIELKQMQAESDKAFKAEELDIRNKQFESDKEFKTEELNVRSKQVENDEAFKVEELNIRDKQLENDKEFRDKELMLRTMQMRGDKVDKIIDISKIGVEVGIFIAGVAMYEHWFKTLLTFEEKGSIASLGGRSLLGSVLKPIRLTK